MNTKKKIEKCLARCRVAVEDLEAHARREAGDPNAPLTPTQRAELRAKAVQARKQLDDLERKSEERAG